MGISMLGRAAQHKQTVCVHTQPGVCIDKVSSNCVRKRTRLVYAPERNDKVLSCLCKCACTWMMQTRKSYSDALLQGA